MAVIVLIVLIAAAAHLARLYWFPFRSCRRCDGTGRRYSRTGRSFGLCAHCAGTRRVMRPGARMVHRAALGIRSPHARERLAVRTTETAERTQVPGQDHQRAAGRSHH